MNVLLILNDPAQGIERSYKALRLARALSTKDAQVMVCLVADVIGCAKRGQTLPQVSTTSS